MPSSKNDELKHKYIKQNLLKLNGKLYLFTVGDTFSVIDTNGRQRISKDIENIFKLDLIKIKPSSLQKTLLKSEKTSYNLEKIIANHIPNKRFASRM